MLPQVSCAYCGRQFKHKGYLGMHENSIISCVTKQKYIELGREQLAERRANPKTQPHYYYYKRWYDKHRQEILQKKKEWYEDPSNKKKCSDWYLKYKSLKKQIEL